MPTYLGPSHGKTGPDLVLVLRDVRFRRNVRIEQLEIVTPTVTYQLAWAEQSLQMTNTDPHGTTHVTLKSAYPSNVNATEDDLLDAIRHAMERFEGYSIRMDCQCLLDSIPVPDVRIRSCMAQWPDGRCRTVCSLDHWSSGAPTWPITPHTTPNDHERLHVRHALGRAIQDGVSAYLELDDNKGWSLQDFVAEFVIRRGAWFDLNASEKIIVRNSDWHK